MKFINKKSRLFATTIMGVLFCLLCTISTTTYAVKTNVTINFDYELTGDDGGPPPPPPDTTPTKRPEIVTPRDEVIDLVSRVLLRVTRGVPFIGPQEWVPVPGVTIETLLNKGHKLLATGTNPLDVAEINTKLGRSPYVCTGVPLTFATIIPGFSWTVWVNFNFPNNTCVGALAGVGNFVAINVTTTGNTLTFTGPAWPVPIVVPFTGTTFSTEVTSVTNEVDLMKVVYLFGPPPVLVFFSVQEKGQPLP